jgi:hypothetical protein
VLGNPAVARTVPSFADRQRDVEEQRFHVCLVAAGDFEEWTAIAARQVGRVYVSDGPLELQALFQQVAHGGEDARVNGLVGLIVGKLQPDGIARYGVRTEVR